MKIKLPQKYNSIYVHIPFCVSRCNYCDFLSHIYGQEQAAAACYSDWVIKELALISPKDKANSAIKTIYFGGGTPTTLEAKDLLKILIAIKQNFAVDPNAEITVETNPGIVDLAYLQTLCQGGFNRLSMGGQSFDDLELAAMGRLHKGSDIKKAVDLARVAGFDNLGVDLIYGLPKQTLAGWQNNLQSAVGLGVEHISLYSLQMDNHSPWGEAFAQGGLQAPDDDMVADMLELALDFLGSNGYRQYEIANFAKENSQIDYASQHNQAYWQRLDYLGLGLGAASCFGHKRWQNIGTLADYSQALDKEQKPLRETEILTEEQILGELVWLGLRRLEGLDIAALQAAYGVDILAYFSQAIIKNQNIGLLHIIEEKDNQDNKILKLTTKGLFLADVVFRDFV